MKITYIGHSGFAIVLSNVTLIFDYFVDEGKVVPQLLKESKKVIVFSSHFHHDHFQKTIFDWQQLCNDITYVLSYDIPKHVRKLHAPENTFVVRPGDELELTDLKINAFGSTDSGCSFLVNVDNYKIFHAGDLNNWNWKDESTDAEMRKMDGDFRKILRDIKEVTSDFYLAMFPVDARMGTEYYLGAKQFVKAFKVKYFIPMHFWDFKDEACDFDLYKNPNYGDYLCVTTPGGTIKL